jgi:copper chaperone CopZ
MKFILETVGVVEDGIHSSSSFKPANRNQSIDAEPVVKPSTHIIEVLTMEPSTLFRTSVRIDGMTCSSCVASIENALKTIPGVESSSVTVTLFPPRAFLSHNPNTISSTKLINEISQMGFEGTILHSVPMSNVDHQLDLPAAETIRVSIHGMTCASCVNGIESYMLQQKGIVSIAVNLLTENVNVFSYCVGDYFLPLLDHWC